MSKDQAEKQRAIEVAQWRRVWAKELAERERRQR